VIRHPRLTVRTRLTLLYASLFAVCGAAVVGVSYTLIARLEPQQQSQQAPASFLDRCHAEQLSAHPDGRVLAKCTSYFQLQGAQHQRHLTNTHLLSYALTTLALTVGLAAIFSWVAAGRALRPVHAITEIARTATEHNLSARIALDGPHDELRELAETIDDMLDRLQTAFEAQQRFIANASHELRTPLAVMRTTVDVVLDDPQATPADLRDMATDIRTAVDHAEHLIGALLLLARNERGLTTRNLVDLATVAEDVVDTTDLGDRHLHTTLEPALVTGDPTLIERLIANLVDNAVRYNTTNGEIWVTTGIGSTSRSATCHVTVANTGPHLEPTDVPSLFEPFHRINDRALQGGFGLGLAIVSSIATIHDGTATAHPRETGGLTVNVTIPGASHRDPADSSPRAHDGEVTQ
jgi:signal transduction histidine kinase